MVKKIVLGVLLSFGMFFSNNASAQAFSKGDFVLGIHGAGSSMFNFYAGGGKSGYGTPSSRLNSYLTGGVAIGGEWAIHDYVGIGFTTGVQGGVSRWNGFWGAFNYGVVSIPVGVVANFHFYQLIDDKSDKDIHADQLDIYAGISLGSGVSILPEPGWVNALFFVGPHAGVRYYFTEKFGVNLELGYGKSFVSGGVVLKL